MASIHKYGGRWHLYFRFAGYQFKPSLKTSDPVEAEARLVEVSQTIRRLERGELALPTQADPAEIRRFILSAGRLTEKPAIVAPVTVERVMEEYFASCVQRQQPATIQCQRTHARRLLRHIAPATPFRAITPQRLQKYAAKRSQDAGVGKARLSAETVKNELRTLAQMWNMAKAKGYVTGDSPTRPVRLAPLHEREALKSWKEIEAIVRREGLTEHQRKRSWDSLFLDQEQVLELLEYVKHHARHECIHAAMALAAFTGIRRCELLRSRIDDWDFERSIVRIRQRQAGSKNAPAVREVEIHPRLAEIMQAWFRIHPGGRYTVVVAPDRVRGSIPYDRPRPWTGDLAQSLFKRTLADGKWQVLRGWLVFRHSFCANAARKGIPDAIIDGWVGHRGNETVKRRYRHLFPCDKRAMLESLF